MGRLRRSVLRVCSYRSRSANGSIVVECWFGYLWDFSVFGFDRTAECDSAVFESDWLNSNQHLSLQICRNERRCGICGSF
jgi:hypothetical protein